MADISKEIQDFQEAECGEEVRGSMISLAEKVNADGEKALSDVAAQVIRINGVATRADKALSDANTATVRANATIDHADDVLDDATIQARASAGSAKLSESWAVGGTGTRAGENTNNSEYHSNQARTAAADARTEADRAARYSSIIAPGFYFDPTTASLYIKAGIGVDFKVVESRLYWKTTA